MNHIEYLDKQAEHYMPLIEAYQGNPYKLRSLLIEAISKACSDTAVEIVQKSYACTDENGDLKLRVIK